MTFQGKVVLVTGASSGIGAATAIEFARKGAHVCLIDINQIKLNSVAKKCGNPLVLITDVSKDEDAKRIISQTVQHFGQLDVLVNNAGMWCETNILLEDIMPIFDKLMATNLRAPVILTLFAVPHLIKTKGNIINISSNASTRVVSKYSFAYNTSKAALDHFTRSIALELAENGVRVNTVNPGPVYTDIIENSGASADQIAAFYDDIKKITALDRVSKPEEVADLILFLASDKAKAITGSSYFTDNGSMVK